MAIYKKAKLKPDGTLEVLEQKFTPSEIYDDRDDKGRKIKHIVIEKIELQDGTIITRTKSMPIGVAELECGHKTPVFNYDQLEWDQLLCYRCSITESKKQGKKVYVKQKKVKVTLNES